MIFPLPSSPQKAPTITEQGILIHHERFSQELFKLVDVFVHIIALSLRVPNQYVDKLFTSISSVSLPTETWLC
jgi:hypothetical protein